MAQTEHKLALRISEATGLRPTQAIKHTCNYFFTSRIAALAPRSLTTFSALIGNVLRVAGLRPALAWRLTNLGINVAETRKDSLLGILVFYR